MPAGDGAASLRVSRRRPAALPDGRPGPGRSRASVLPVEHSHPNDPIPSDGARPDSEEARMASRPPHARDTHAADL